MLQGILILFTAVTFLWTWSILPSLHVQKLLINLCLSLNPKLNLALKSTVCRQKINLFNVQRSILKTGCRAQVRIEQLMKNISDVTFCREKDVVGKVKNKTKRKQAALKRKISLHVKFFLPISVLSSTVLRLDIRSLEGTRDHSVTQNKYGKWDSHNFSLLLYAKTVSKILKRMEW